MINIDVTLFIQMANFIIFLYLMNVVLYRPVRQMVAKRQQLVREQQERIAAADAEALAAVQEFEERIQEARNLGRQKVQELKDAGYQHEKDLMQRAAEEAARQLQELRERIQRDIGAARDRLRAQIQAFAMDLAQKILGRSL